MYNKYKFITILILTISILFVLPYNIKFVSAAATGPATSSGDNAATRGDVKSACDIIPPLSIKDSLLLSIVFICIPGILEKAQEWKQIKCNQVVCSYNAVVNELDPGFCTKEAQYSTCEYIIGEMFAIPPLSLLKYVKDFIANILANPVGIAYSVVVINARATISGTCSLPLLCQPKVIPVWAAVPVVLFTDVSSIAQTFKDISENGFFPKTPDDDNCDRMDDIKNELEKIVNS